MALTNNQKEFILTFFNNEKYAGCKNIATKLIENGECTVPGSECIWRGGIGNFIILSEFDSYLDCVKYSFDLSVFLSSAWFKEIRELRENELLIEAQNAAVKYKEIQELTTGG